MLMVEWAVLLRRLYRPFAHDSQTTYEEAKQAALPTIAPANDQRQ